MDNLGIQCTLDSKNVSMIGWQHLIVRGKVFDNSGMIWEENER